MIVPLEITYRGVQKTDTIDQLIRDQAAKLEKACDHISSCRVVVEQPHESQHSGRSFQVRLDITVPPGNEVVVRRESGKGDMHDPIGTVLREAFQAARRQLVELVDRQLGRVKTHAEQEAQAEAAEVSAVEE